MRTNFTLGLAAIALGFGIASTAAAQTDSNRQSTAPPSSLLPQQGSFAAGFSAIKMHRENSLQEDDLMRSERNPAWREGLTALTAGFAGEGAISQSVGAQEAFVSLPGMQPNPNGFAAIKAARSRGGSDRALENQLSGDKAAPNYMVSPPSK